MAIFDPNIEEAARKLWNLKKWEEDWAAGVEGYITTEGAAQQAQEEELSGMGQYLTLEELFVHPLPELCRVIAILVGIIGQLEKKLYSYNSTIAYSEEKALWLVDLWYPFAEEGKRIDNSICD